MVAGNRFRVLGKPNDEKKTFLRLISYTKTEKKFIYIAAMLILVSIVSSLMSSYMLRPIINEYIIPGNISGLLISLLYLTLIYFIGIISNYILRKVLIIVGQKTALNIRKELFNKVQKLPIKYFDTHQHGNIMSHFTNDMDRIGETLTDSISSIISGLFMIIGVLSVMIYISPILTIVAIIMSLLMFFCAKFIATNSRKYFKQQQEIIAKTNGFIEESISAHVFIKSFGIKDFIQEKFSLLNNNLLLKTEKSQFYSGLMAPVVQTFNILNFVFITILGSILVIYRGFDVGGVVSFIQYSRQLGRPINDISTLYNSIQAALAGAERIFNTIDKSDETIYKNKQYLDVQGSISFSNVTFGYEENKTILKNISFSAKKGEKIAFVGATGAGKTSILNLLPRFFDFIEGDITIDGVSIKNINRECLRKSMGIVLQDTHLFSGTVRENIRFGNLQASDEDVEKAAKLVVAHSFIKRLPHGYDSILNDDGLNLSQGQRQLLSIARAAIANPPILLLDEATSNIDTRSEILIQKGLDRLMLGRTTIVIAHRLSTVENADKIIVLDDGEIIEKGKHKDLLSRKGKYFDLYEKQFN